MIPAAVVHGAFDLHHEACRQALARLEGEVPGAVFEEVLVALEGARADFLAAISR
jgi:hypothetical protein